MLITRAANELSTLIAPPIALAIAAWLDAKSKRSGSRKTARAYADAIADFRNALLTVGLDLDSDPRPVSLTAQAFAGSRKKGQGDVSASTYNQRLAIISSFYAYARKQGLLDIDNPIARLDRRSAHAYQHAQPIEQSALTKALKAIDRTSIEGKRDYALLSVALSTGRRVAELAALRRADLYITNGSATVTFQRTKGGKTAIDTLSSAVSRVLIEYLYAAYGAEFASRPTDAPIWSSTSRNDKGRKTAIGTHAIGDICLKRLGTSKVHTLRHTYAHTMQAVGAPPSVIQAKLGHESLATTGRYLAALTRADNPHADALAKALGIK